MDLGKLNGNGSGKQLLQIIPVNIVVILTTIGAAVGLYWKFDERISTLEKSPLAMTEAERKELFDRVKVVEKKIDDLGPSIVETHTNVLWLMDKQSGNSPKRPDQR